MKVLSLTEPFATLIKEKKKHVETRGWKTNYRGELYIHASKTTISKETLQNKELMSLVDNQEMNFGFIIFKCNLVDCVYMTDEYVKEMKNKNHQEYICGEYSVGRYAWILEDITPIIPIPAKGQLSIWNYYDEFEIMDLMHDIEYGWMDKNNDKHSSIDNTFSDTYQLQSPNEIINSKVGVCWDQVELERYYFKANAWNIRTYFIVYYDQDKCPTHTFLTFQKDNKYYWFEHSWKKYLGIWQYDTMESLLLDIKNKFIMDEVKDKYQLENLCLFEYIKPSYHLSVQEFYTHCEKGNIVNI